ncbi:APC family permease, partial [Staphylococcus aureus]
EPVGWALRQSGHGVVAAIVQAISVIGMFTALIGMMLAGSRLLYSFGRDGLLPSWLSHLNDKHLPNRALVILTIIGVFIGSMFPFAFLAQLISAGTLVAFMFVSLAMYRLRKREGKDLPIPAFKLPLYPVLPAVTFVLVLLVFWGLGFEAKLYTLIWFIVGIILYLSYGFRHSKKNDVAEYHPPK